MKTFLLALTLLMVAGCASDPLAIKAVADVNAKIAKTATIDITCPPTGCVFANFKYTDPNNKHYQKMPTNGWDALTSLGNNAKDIVTGTVPGLVVGSVVRKGFESAGHNSTNTNTASGDGSSTGGAGSFSQIGPDSANSANVTTTTSSDSHAVTTTTTSTDNHADNSQTATPTVVTTPAPVAVLP